MWICTFIHTCKPTLTLQMLLKSIRRMHGLCFEGRWRWTHHFLLVIWLSLLAATPPKALGYFLADTKVVLKGCEDHWTLQDRAAMPLLSQMTLCVDIRVVVPGAWVAFSYSSVHAPRPELGLEGDEEALYGWLLRVRHRFPVRLSPTYWHRVCLRRDVARNSFSLEVDGKMVAERTVIAQAIPPYGSLWLGCRPRDRPPGAKPGEVELYLFRMWADVGDHGLCEDGTVIGWSAQHWGVTSPRARQRDPSLLCALTLGFGRSFSPPSEVPLTVTTSSPVIATPATHISNQTPTVTVSTPTGSTTVNSYQTEPPSVMPSANHSTEENPSNLQRSFVTPLTNVTPLTTLTPDNPTRVSSTASPTADWTHSAVPLFTTVPASSTTLLADQTTPRRTLTSRSPLVNCDVSQLCSNNNAYFWMPISVEANGGSKTEQDVYNLVSNAFGCHGDGGDAAHGVTDFIDLCQDDRRLQAVQVNCSVKSNIRQTTCAVLLQLSHAVSVCELQRAGVSALQQAGDEQIQARITGEVERVGRDVCGDMEPSSGGFVRCTSTSSLDDICQANKHSELTCSLVEPDSNPAAQPKTESCSSDAPRFCDCAAFCNSASQFFAIRININSVSVDINILKGLLSELNATRTCFAMSGSECQDILKQYKRAHLECHGTQQRLYSCMVILEMSGPVNGCSLNKLLQQVITSRSGITNERPLTRMVVCGAPGLALRTLLASNLTWVASDLLTSDVCQPDPTLLKCEVNESLAVLLTDTCPPEPSTTMQSTRQPSTLTNSNITTTPEALTPSVTNTTEETYTTAENTATVQQTNASQETAQPNMTTPLVIVDSTQSSTTQPVLQTSSQNMTVTVSDSTTVQNTTLSDNTTLLTPRGNTKLQNTTTAPQNTTEFITISPINSTLQMTTAAPIDSTLNTTALSPNHTTVETVSHSHNHTTVHNVVTVTPSNNRTTVIPATNHTTMQNVATVTPLNNHTTVHNVTTVTPSNNHTTVNNVTTVSHSNNHTTVHNVTTVTPSDNHTVVNNVTTVLPSTNHTTVHNVTTVTPSNNHTAENSVTTITPSTNHTTAHNVTTVTPSNNHTAENNVTTITPSTNHTTAHNVTTVTPSDNHTVVNNVTTVSPSNNHTTVHNVTTITPSNNHTVKNNATTITPLNSHTTAHNVTTITPLINHTTVHNVSAVTSSTNHTTAHNATTITPLNNHTTVHNVTAVTPSDNHTTAHNVTTVTPSDNHTVVTNVTVVSPSNSHTTVHNVSAVTPPTNHTTAHNLTTVTVDTTLSHTMANNVTAAANNHTTDSNNYSTEYNVTTANNNRMLHNGSVTINTTVGTVTPSPNHTEVYNVTTAANNFTTVDNVTTADRNTNLNNGTITTNNATISTFTPSPNHTLVDNVTAVSNNHTNNITTTTVHQNKTATDNVTTAPTRETQQNTTVPYKNMTSTTARQVNVTLNNATTSTKNTTVDNVTPVVNNTTEPTVTPLNNQTGNHTTVGVTHNITTANGNDNFTTATTVVSATSNLNQTTGISFNLSTTTSSSTTNVNLTTKGPGVNLTTATANVNATSPTTTATTMHGTTSAQINTTTLLTTIAKPSLNSSTTTLQTTTTTDTTTTKSETTTSQGAQEEQADELLSQTQDASQFNSSQVAQVVGNLEKLLDGPTVSQSVGQKAATVISNLLEGDSLALSASAKRLIHLVDDLGLKLVVTGDRAVLSAGSLVLAVRTVDGTNFPTTFVDIFNTDNIQLRALGRSRSKRSGSALGSVVLPSSLTTGLSPEQQRQASRVQFTFYTKSAFFQDAALDNQTIVSPVLAASVANLSISNLKENIQFTIRSINPTDANATCAFWDFTQNGGNGGWSSAGCFVVNATQEETTCSCNHLTSFAILLDLSRGGIIDRQHAQILTFITYIGCGISAIFLAVTLLTYLAFPKLLRDIPAKILVQLCVSLLFLNLVFLLDGWLALYPAVGLCISTAFFLHYFLLTSFTWAGLEALHMYLSIVRVFTPYLSRYMLKFSLVGWGIPLIIVIIVIAVDKDNYGVVTYGRYTDGTSDDFCWLRNDIAFYVGVVAYFLLIFALCLVVFIIVMVQLSRIKKQNPQNQPPNRSVMTDLRSIAGLIILLGLTWGFALFAWGPLYIPFVYLFSIFNSLQGFLVFVFHCAVKENVRRQWRTYLCCGKLRLAENSEWSRTATQNNRNLSVTTATTSAPHFTSRSASVISDATNSSGSVFVDSGISDGSNSDTVLNDIHRQNLSL
ncbi:uncharacterized protein adgrg2a isoform X2 [Epinephelus lanceolatus]